MPPARPTRPSSPERHPGRPGRHRTVPVLVAALVALTALLAACGSSGSGGSSGAAAGTPETLPARDEVAVRLGYFPNVTHAPALVGLQQGLFSRELDGIGATLQTKSFNAGPEATEALFADALDITYIGPNPSVNAFQKSGGEAVRIVAGSTSGGAKFVVKPDVGSAADLKGKTIASPQLGGTQDIALRHWLKEQGLRTDTSGGGDVSIKPQANADTLTTFKAGDIQGAWVPAPWDTRLVEEGGGKVLVDEKDLWPNGQFATTVILVRTQFLKDHPAAVAAVLRGHLASLDSIRKDPAAAQKAANDEIEKATSKRVGDALIAASWSNLQFLDDPLAATVRTSAEDAVDLGLSKPIDLGPLFSLDLLNRELQAAGKPTVNSL